MAYPSDKTIQSLIRNQIEEVSRFLEEKHHNSYKIFNLCIETDYDIRHFNKNVEFIPLEDHNPPKFLQIIDFCNKVQEWLNKNEEHVAVVHCKAGKGRTGTMISCYLLYAKLFDSPFDAMLEFSKQRCIDSKGVTIPSQRRYVEYFHDYLKHNRVYKLIKTDLKSIVIIQPNHANKDCFKQLSFKVYKDRVFLIYESQLLKTDKGAERLTFQLDALQIADDVKISFFDKKKENVFDISFNTFGLYQENENANDETSCLGTKRQNSDGTVTWSLKKKNIDMVFKAKNVDPEFEVELTFIFPKSDDLTTATIENQPCNNQAQATLNFLNKKNSSNEEGINEEEAISEKPKFKKNESKGKNFFLSKIFTKRSRNRLSKSVSMHTTIREASVESIRSEP